MRWAGPVARTEESSNAFKILTGAHTGKRLLGNPRRRWEGNIRMDLIYEVFCLLESPCECPTELPVSIRHRVSDIIY